MTPAQVALLGVAQGVAEVVPVSSSAQLVLLPWLLRWQPPGDRTAFAAALHAGSCAGIAWAVRDDLRQLDRRTLVLLAGTSVPAALAGLTAAVAVEQRLGRPPQLAGLLAGAGLMLWWADSRSEGRTGRPVGPREAAWAALAQVAALAPGVSRSGATLTALRLAGVDRTAAARFTTLMSLPVTAGAAVLTLVRARGAGARTAAPGVLTSVLAGATSATLLRRRGGQSARAAALYRLGLAAVVLRRLSSEGEP